MKNPKFGWSKYVFKKQKHDNVSEIVLTGYSFFWSKMFVFSSSFRGSDLLDWENTTCRYCRSMFSCVTYREIHVKLRYYEKPGNIGRTAFISIPSGAPRIFCHPTAAWDVHLLRHKRTGSSKDPPPWGPQAIKPNVWSFGRFFEDELFGIIQVWIISTNVWCSCWQSTHFLYTSYILSFFSWKLMIDHCGL